MEHSMTLVVFTFLSQLAIGGFAALFLLDVYQQKVSKKAGFISLITILAISAVAVIVSVFHLGHPFAAYRALLNFDDSWLTREIVFFPFFILSALIYTFGAKTKGIGWLTVILGAITIYCTSMIYTIPSVPAWNNGMTMAAFFATALLVGPIFIVFLLSIVEGKSLPFSKYHVAMAAAVILLNVINLTILKGGFPASVATASILISSPLFWTKMVGLVIGMVIAGYSLKNKNIYSGVSVTVIFVCFAAAEFIGRILFYSSGIHL